MIVRNAASPEGIEPQFSYRTYDAIGWEPTSTDCREFPPRLAAFVESSDDGVDDPDSGWREWETPANAEFTVTLPGGETSVILRM